VRSRREGRGREEGGRRERRGRKEGEKREKGGRKKGERREKGGRKKEYLEPRKRGDLVSQDPTIYGISDHGLHRAFHVARDVTDLPGIP
jgi:hypothetical protein